MVGLSASVLVRCTQMVLRTAARGIYFSQLNQIMSFFVCGPPSHRRSPVAFVVHKALHELTPAFLSFRFLLVFLPSWPCLLSSAHWLSGVVWPTGPSFAVPLGCSVLPAGLCMAGSFLHQVTFSGALPPSLPAVTQPPRHYHIPSGYVRCSYLQFLPPMRQNIPRICWWLFPHPRHSAWH